MGVVLSRTIAIPMGKQQSLTPQGAAQTDTKSFILPTYGCWQKISTLGFLSLLVIQRLAKPVSLIHPSLYHKPILYVTSPPHCSAACNTPASVELYITHTLRGAALSSSKTLVDASCSTWPSFCLCVFVFFSFPCIPSQAKCLEPCIDTVLEWGLGDNA